jgi:hypothetical protein
MVSFKAVMGFFIFLVFAVGIFTIFSINKVNQPNDPYITNDTTVSNAINMSGNLNSSTASWIPTSTLILAALFLGGMLMLAWAYARGKRK